jgi:hypothetical protein
MSDIKLTIDEVIEHCERIVQSYASTNIDEIIAERGTELRFVKRYLEHKQVAEWLKELKHLRGAMERIVERLEVKKRSDDTESDREWGKYIGYVDAIKIVKEEGGIE